MKKISNSQEICKKIQNGSDLNSDDLPVDLAKRLIFPFLENFEKTFLAAKWKI